ncbi:MAG: RNA polymerase sigma factor [Gammaproteobacteria bacterium]|nr:RNA polymerase sigma factor [Gammaproteobacteria bacterium]
MTYLKLFGKNREFICKLENIRPRLFRLAYSWCHQRDLADDLVQETLTKAFKSEKQLKNIEQFDNWAFRILINTWRNHLSRNRIMENIDDYIFTDEHTPETLHEQYQINTFVHSAVADLPLGQRQVLTLIDLEGLSYSEVSDILEIPIGTVMSRICRARKSLAGKLFQNPSNAEYNATILRRVK